MINGFLKYQTRFGSGGYGSRKSAKQKTFDIRPVYNETNFDLSSKYLWVWVVLRW